MAGFPCSAFITLHVTAIIILQGAAISVQNKATRNVTMPGSNASRALGKTQRTIPAENGQLQVVNGLGNNNHAQDDFSEDSAVYKLRIEMIKAEILAKLQLDRQPVLKEKPNESRIAALLANLNLIEEENEENQLEDAEEEYYGKTTKIIVFSEKAKVPPSRSKRNSSGKLVFQFKLEKNVLSSSVPSAFLWMHMRKSKHHELNGKLLHIQTLYEESEKETIEIPDVRVLKTRVKKEKKSGSGWIVVDIKDIVQHWFNKTASQYNATDRTVRSLEISCQDCETETSHLISSRGRLRPFLVIDLEKPKAPNRKKRAIECVGRAVQCCRRSLYVNFTKIGWDSWVMYPKGFHANFCEGSCESSISPLNEYSVILQEIERKKLARFSICCTPSKMSGLSMLHFDRDGNIIKRDVPNMRVDACGCS